MPQSDAGTHLVYHDEAAHLSFVWDGRSPVIEVSSAYCEPVIDTIPINGRVNINNATIQRWMDWFELVCRNYVRLQTDTTQEGNTSGTEESDGAGSSSNQARRV